MINLLDTVLRRERAMVLAGLATVTALSWGYLLLDGGRGQMQMMAMPDGSMMAMGEMSGWTPHHFVMMLVMWVIMMVAMMLPGAAPTILLVASIARKRMMPRIAALFTLGYVLVWGGFSVTATTVQWMLDRVGLLSPEMASVSTVLTSIIAVTAGVYQWTSLKQSCLAHCRSPLDFIMHHWREGTWGAVVSGMRHGLFCLGCCWMLMTLLFVGGLMNLLWIGALAVMVLFEKILPWGGRMSRITGVALALWGITVATTAFFPLP